jgi:cation diffusion facilitator CzcD-associated flavoprotein CzcO
VKLFTTTAPYPSPDPSNTEADELQPEGWAGLPVAKTYLELHQDAKVIVLDAQSSLGGVWAEERLYPGLMSNNMVGTYEYSDFPMDEETWGVKPGDHIPGQTVHDYLKKYAEKFGVLPHIRLNSKVESVQRGEKGGWLLGVGDQKDQIIARKLVLATGMTSEAFIPKIEGEESFEVPLFHIKDFPKHASTMDTVKSVTILGSTKAAWDAVYAYGSKGIEVNWIVRGRQRQIHPSTSWKSVADLS